MSMLQRRLRRVGVAGLLAAALTGSAAAQTPAPVMQLKKLAPDVYMMQNPTGSSNSSFIVTHDGVVVFDADIRTADQTLAAIRKTTDRKIRYVVISHPAGDHATGIWHFREDKPIFIATRTQMRDLYQQEAAEFAERHASNDPGSQRTTRRNWSTLTWVSTRR